MRVSASLPTGVSALLFGEALGRRRLEQRLVEVIEAAGFAEVVLPVLDYYEPYAALLSEAAGAELYRFTGRDGELLALRADFTPFLARLLAPRLAALELPLSLFYRGDVVRQRDERLGQERELYQLGVERVGASGAAAERELLRLFLALLSRAVPGGVDVVLGFAGALDELLLAGDDPVALARAVARRERAPARRASAALLSVVSHGRPECAEALGRAAPRLAELTELVRELASEFPSAALAVDLAEFATAALDARLAAARDGRSYYDGLVFRAYGRGSAAPLGSGGRYDRLFAALGAPVGALGFSLDLDALLRESRTRGGG